MRLRLRRMSLFVFIAIVMMKVVGFKIPILRRGIGRYGIGTKIERARQTQQLRDGGAGSFAREAQSDDVVDGGWFGRGGCPFLDGGRRCCCRWRHCCCRHFVGGGFLGTSIGGSICRSGSGNRGGHVVVGFPPFSLHALFIMVVLVVDVVVVASGARNSFSPSPISGGTHAAPPRPADQTVSALSFRSLVGIGNGISRSGFRRIACRRIAVVVVVVALLVLVTLLRVLLLLLLLRFLGRIRPMVQGGGSGAALCRVITLTVTVTLTAVARIARSGRAGGRGVFGVRTLSRAVRPLRVFSLHVMSDDVVYGSIFFVLVFFLHFFFDFFFVHHSDRPANLTALGPTIQIQKAARFALPAAALFGEVGLDGHEVQIAVDGHGVA
mmetsp:Transcript_20611/g.41487  ORF Transcript_20611/g.41487 Transcript_20611/m.41487 type:complete len:381 (+) Transcript_20611:442-1584(+)